MAADKPENQLDQGVKVPKEEDIKIIEMRLPEVIISVAALATLSGLGYLFYSRVRVKAETARYKAMSEAAANIMGSATAILSGLQEYDIYDRTASNGGTQVKPNKKTPRVKKGTAK